MFVKMGVASSDPKKTLGLPEASGAAHDDTIRRSRDGRILFMELFIGLPGKHTHTFVWSPVDRLQMFLLLSNPHEKQGKPGE